MKYIYIVLTLAFLFSACNDVLDVLPENSVTFENYFQTDKDMETFLNSIRSGVRNISGYRWTVEIVGDKYDKYKSSLADLIEWKTSFFSPKNVSFYWDPYYAIIANANILLENIDRGHISEERKNYYRGQAHFYRALCYFWMAQYWGECPIQKSSRNIIDISKSSIEDVLQFALDETNLAISLLPKSKDAVDASGNSMVEKKYNACQEVAKSLKLEICLWKGAVCNELELFQDAIKCANYVIDSCDFQLANDPAEVCEKVLYGNSQEGIYEIEYNESEIKEWNSWTAAKNAVCFPIKPGEGRGTIKNSPNICIKQETIDQLYPGTYNGKITPENFDGDRRRLEYVYDMDTIINNPEWEKQTGGYAYPYKFRKIQVGTNNWNKGKFKNLAGNWVIWRLADIILLRAEAYAWLGNIDKAAQDINRIRERAYGNSKHNYTAAEGDIRYAVFKERERELLWEGKRWWDIVRNGYWKTELWEFHKTLTEEDVRRGALYMPVGKDQNVSITQNAYWQSRY